MGGGGWLKTSEYHLIGWEGSKIAQKKRYIIFERFLTSTESFLKKTWQKIVVLRPIVIRYFITSSL